MLDDDIPVEFIIQFYIDKGVVERLGYRFDKETWKKAHLGDRHGHEADCSTPGIQASNNLGGSRFAGEAGRTD